MLLHDSDCTARAAGSWQATVQTLPRLADLVADLDRHGTETTTGLRELVDNGVRHVPGCQYSGVSLADDNHRITSVAATHRYPVLLDEIENAHGSPTP